ncbi:MAG: D-sedoheptulose 7-phosphate isomerase [bacterium]
MHIEKGFSDFLNEHKALFCKLDEIAPNIIEAAELIVNTLKNKKKILICGNGGSASDAQHFAAEIVGRFEKERKALPAVALTTDSSILTALGNDYGYDTIFSRQLEALSVPGDILVGISTSGNSGNVISAIEKAKINEVKSIGLLGRAGGKLASKVDKAVIVPHFVTARIQEAHIFIIHFWAAYIEQKLFVSN